MKTTEGKTRTVARGTRSILICRPANKRNHFNRQVIGQVEAKNLGEALKIWYARERESLRLENPGFTGNTLTVSTPFGDETYVAVDA
jgi:hypothetical protein